MPTLADARFEMLREVALRKALQDARDRRQVELTDVQERGRAMRRRLRELTDRSLALGSVHSRFVPEAPLDRLEAHEPPSIGEATPSLPSPAPAPEPRQPPP